ncbi:hypothetical protein ACW9UR_02190 [Halovulum sp. GXIMD14794]
MALTAVPHFGQLPKENLLRPCVGILRDIRAIDLPERPTVEADDNSTDWRTNAR